MERRGSRAVGFVLAFVLMFFGSIGAVYAETDITVLYTNDVHSYIDEDIQYSDIAAYKDSLGEDVLLVDAGDHIQGTAYGSMDDGETIVELMNAAGYDLATLGNHEFDYGMEGALSTIENADFEYVSCNFYSINDDGTYSTVLAPYAVFEVDGVKIAFIGITTPESITKSTPAYFQDDDGNYIYGIYGGTDGTELYEAVQEAIDAASEEADVIIALGHLGVDESSSPWTSEEVIANTSGLDAFIDGHSHTTMESETVTDKDGNSVILTQTGCYLDTLGQMTISVADDGAVTISTELLDSDDLAAAGITADSEVEAIENEWIASVDEQLGETIAESDIEFTIYDESGNRLIRTNETNMGDLNADAYYWYINEVANIDCDVAIMNGGGIRASAEAGEWSYLTCKTINTFGNVLCVVEVSGQDILDALEFGARYSTGDAADEDNAECGGFLQVAGLTYKVDTSVENTVQTDENSIWISGPTEYRVYDVKVYNKETGEYEDLDLDATYNLGGTNYTLRDCGDGFDMFSDSYLVLDGICEDYLALAAYVMAFTDTDGNGLADIATENSPLAEYEGYLLDYETSTGSGRIQISALFTDVKDETSCYYDAVYALAEAGYIYGYSDGSFGVDDSLTRAQLVAILYRIAGEPEVSATSSFSDVSADAYYADAIAWAAANGLVSGYGDGTFGPDDPATFEQFCKIIASYACGGSDNVASEQSLDEFTDAEDVSTWAEEYVAWCVENGIVSGTDDGQILPQNDVPRWRAAVVIARYLGLAE